MSLPLITIVGNLKKIELKYTSSGKAVCSFQVECAEKNAKGEYQNLYIKGECWDKQAEFVNQYFREGMSAIVTGKLFTNVYEKQDGTKVYETKLLFPSVGFVPKDKAGTTQQQPQHSYNQPQQKQAPAYEYQNANGQQVQPQQSRMPEYPPEIDIDMDDIPFNEVR